MAYWKSEAEARKDILRMVAQYYFDFKEKKEPFQEGDRITYAARVYDEKEMCGIVESANSKANSRPLWA
jgi:CDP-6-deoxy-D-xylo-4-hexulose-3-dehydrase